MSAGPLVDKIDPFKRSPKKKPKKSQGSSRYHSGSEADLQPLPLLKGKRKFILSTLVN
jgi:serine/threonine-protein phosphatase 2A regulatory subunit B'